MRIVSFLPAATEMVCALGLTERLVGITHECDYPPQIAGKPVVVQNALALERLSPREIDAAVSAQIGGGVSLYRVNEDLLRQLAPNLILTQNLCQACAPSGIEISVLLKSLDPPPRVLWFTPKSLAGIEANLRELGQATGCLDQAEAIIASSRAALERLAGRLRNAPSRPRVFFMEWTDPVYCSGHWVPEMVDLAGGVDALSRRGADSVRLTWQAVLDWAPEVLVVSPCGFRLEGAVQQAHQLSNRARWRDLPAVRQGRVYAVDANVYFARPGPRVIQGIQLLAHLLHPGLCDWTGPEGAFQTVV